MATNNQPAEGKALAKRDTSPIGQFKAQIQSRASDLAMALPGGAKMLPRFQHALLTAVAQNPELLEADRQSLILAIYKAANDGLPCDGRSAALVIYRQRKKINGSWQSVKTVQYQPMVHGIRQKILNATDAHGNRIIGGLDINVVYRAEWERGWFKYEAGQWPPFEHHPCLDLTAEETTDDQIIAAYSIASFVDGSPKSYEIMRRFELDKVRQCSQTGALGQKAKWDDPKNGIKKGDPIDPSGPWVDWYPEQCKKTVLKRHSKSLPQYGDLILDAFSDADVQDEIVGMSAATVLSVPGGEPELLTDDSDGSTYDAATGEVLDDGADSDQQEDPAKAKKKASTRGKAKADAEPEKEEDPAKEPEADEQTGITKDPAEAKADEFLDRFGNAANVIDLDRIHDEFEKESDGWPYEIVQAVEAGFKRHERRLAPNRAAAEPETAK